MEILRRLYKDEAGQGLVEYGLILALIAVVCISALILLGGKVNDQLDAVNDGLDGVTQ